MYSFIMKNNNEYLERFQPITNNHIPSIKTAIIQMFTINIDTVFPVFAQKNLRFFIVLFCTAKQKQVSAAESLSIRFL